MQFFSAMIIFAPENMKKINLVSIANPPKTSPNLNLCSIKIAHRTTYIICIMTLPGTLGSTSASKA
jgi:hypothetical protein